MNIKQDTLITLILSVVIGLSFAVLAVLLTLIVQGYEQGNMPQVHTGSILVGAIGILIAVLWFIVKAMVGHIAAHWALRKMNERKRKEQEEDEKIDLADIPEVDEEWFKKARLTKPGESLIEKDRKNGTQDR